MEDRLQRLPVGQPRIRHRRAQRRALSRCDTARHEAPFEILHPESFGHPGDVLPCFVATMWSAAEITREIGIVSTKLATSASSRSVSANHWSSPRQGKTSFSTVPGHSFPLRVRLRADLRFYQLRAESRCDRFNGRAVEVTTAPGLLSSPEQRHDAEASERSGMKIDRPRTRPGGRPATGEPRTATFGPEDRGVARWAGNRRLTGRRTEHITNPGFTSRRRS